ncbi:MAG: GNAT family N-acetyltransferase [Pseudomonadota bacterium]
MKKVPFSIVDGFPESQRDLVVRLFWQAFRQKLNQVMQPETKAQAFLRRVADPTHAVSALSPDGSVIGIAGFKTANGAFIGGGLGDMCAVYGIVGGFWRGLLLSLLERPLQAETLLMDGIFVGNDARGQGVGTSLLTAIKERAVARGCSHVRLDVIDNNPRARRLYEQQGFVAEETIEMGPLLRRLFRFRRATTMIWTKTG